MGSDLSWLGPALRYMAGGLGVTAVVAVASIIIATVLGMIIGLGLVYASKVLRWVCRLYVEVFRGVPSLIILLFVFFALPQIGVKTSPVNASILGLSLWASANVAEIFRGALQSVPGDQLVSARALGFSAPKAILHVVLPQAIRAFLPPFIGQVTQLVQATALTSIVGVSDLQNTAGQMIERVGYVTGQSYAILIYLIVMAVFFAICYPLTVLSSRLEVRLRR